MQLRQIRDIEYQLLPGSDRQTTDIVIERSGVITVRPPMRMTPEQADETVLSKRMWIYRNLAEWRDLNATRVTREWVSGESFLYLVLRPAVITTNQPKPFEAETRQESRAARGRT